ncbi:hypothetical protein Z517_06441 [Fonsecaea pedrosoi CBS 271.37]|uniref:Amino acid permease/ SLC12A domain-containing protein n=1 Tax=Fonsecaea pedrosoi CBS 271.37 TaxID=1442368 RepID=A0A0D2DPX8_9EURO|nr:uncharacterized protein Z517_06441 [Fonsecaea pedrosoi CBS 271.37]KIW79826.1 hypothetical protein Z517_06441 [Fonsecaea pedrosoi CBS 271.37]
MNTVSVLANFNSGHGLGSLTQYACIGANIMFLSSAIITSFASMLGDPFNHFNSHPYWMFTNFCSFAVASANISVAGTISSRFRNVADSVPEPGLEDKRVQTLKTAFYLSTTLCTVFAVATALLAGIWGRAASENVAFVVPCTFGAIAVLLDLAAIMDNFKRFKEETTSVELE